MNEDSKSGRLIDDVHYFMGSESVHIINGLWQLLSNVLIALVQQREIIEGDESGPSLIVEQAARIEKLEDELAAMKRMAHIWTIKAAKQTESGTNTKGR